MDDGTGPEHQEGDTLTVIHYRVLDIYLYRWSTIPNKSTQRPVYTVQQTFNFICLHIIDSRRISCIMPHRVGYELVQTNIYLHLWHQTLRHYSVQILASLFTEPLATAVTVTITTLLQMLYRESNKNYYIWNYLQNYKTLERHKVLTTLYFLHWRCLHSSLLNKIKS